MSRSRKIAIVIDLDWTRNRHHELFAGIQSFATQTDWECGVWPYPPDDIAEREDGNQRKSKALRSKYDGIIGRVSPLLARVAMRHRIPMVNVWFSSPVRELPLVSQDSRTAGKWAAEHLIARGFTRFAFLGFQRSSASREREAGFLEAIGRQSQQVSRLLVSSSFSDSAKQWNAFRKALLGWVKHLTPSLGMFVADDMVARYAVNALQSQGLRVPQDVAIVSAENESVVCLNPEPSLTSIDFGYERVGYQAAELLEGLMCRRKPPKHPVLVPPRELVVRASTDAFAVADPLVAQALRFIANESHHRITVEDVVNHVPTSGRTLSRRFQRTRGHTIIEEITHMRLERAKRLLVENDLPIKQVASASGFSNSKRLCEVFTRSVGMSPGAYRCQHAAMDE